MLGDDPDFDSVGQGVSRHQSEVIFQTELILGDILRGHFAPVTGLMPRQELLWLLASLGQGV